MTYDKKSIGPVISFIIWLSLFGVVCIVGISNVFAATYNSNSYTAQLYDNYGPSLHDVTTEFSNMSWRGTIPHMAANTSGAAWGISSPIPLLSNHTYSMTVKIEGTYGGNLILSTYNRIGVGTSLSNAKSSYENNTNCTLNYSNSISSNMTLQFAFTPAINSNYIVFPFATTYTGDNQSFYLYDIIIDDLGSSGVNETTINNSLNNQTNEINNSITNSENNINSNIDDMEQSIVNSNKETQEIIKDQFNSCRDSYNLINYKNIQSGPNTTVSLIDNGFKVKGLYAGILTVRGLKKNTDYYLQYETENITGNIKMVVLFPSGQQSVSLKSFLNGTGGTFNTGNNTAIDIWFYSDSGSNSYEVNYTNIMINEGSNKISYEQYGKQVCVNKLDEQNETSKGIFGKLKDLFDWLTNKDDADVSSAGDTAGWLPPGPIDSIITLPLTMLNNINLSLNKTCSPLNVNLPYVNKSVEIPCLSAIFNQITGLNSFWTWVGLISSVLILYRYLINLYKYYDRLTTLQANFISDWGSI